MSQSLWASRSGLYISHFRVQRTVHCNVYTLLMFSAVVKPYHCLKRSGIRDYGFRDPQRPVPEVSKRRACTQRGGYRPQHETKSRAAQSHHDSAEKLYFLQIMEAVIRRGSAADRQRRCYRREAVKTELYCTPTSLVTGDPYCLRRRCRYDVPY